MESRELDVAVAAGLLVGEGCLAANVSKDGKWSCEVQVGSREKEIINFFQRVVGTGSVFLRRDGMWMFHASTAKAAHVVKLLLPFLIGSKKKQAELFLEYAATFARKPGRQKGDQTSLRLARKLLVEEIKRLKRDFSTDNGVNSVEAPTGHTEPSPTKGLRVVGKVYRLEGEEPTNKPSTSAPAERHDIVGTLVVS